MKKRRVSKQSLETQKYLINTETNHKVTLFFTQGCGVYVTIDEVDYVHIRRDGTGEGISNKKAFELLKPLAEKACQNFMESMKRHLE